MSKRENYLYTRGICFSLVGLEKFLTEEELENLYQKLKDFSEISKNMRGIDLNDQLERITIEKIKDKTTKRLTAIEDSISLEKEEQPLFDMAATILECNYNLKNLKLNSVNDEKIIAGYAKLLKTSFGLVDENDYIAQNKIDYIMHNGTKKKLYNIDKVDYNDQYFDSKEAMEAKYNYLSFLSKYNLGMRQGVLKEMGYSAEFLQKISTARLELVRKTLNLIYGNHVAIAQESEALVAKKRQNEFKRVLKH